jgi:hypothetical protein
MYVGRNYLLYGCFVLFLFISYKSSLRFCAMLISKGISQTKIIQITFPLTVYSKHFVIYD